MFAGEYSFTNWNVYPNVCKLIPIAVPIIKSQRYANVVLQVRFNVDLSVLSIYLGNNLKPSKFVDKYVASEKKTSNVEIILKWYGRRI